MSKAKLMIVPSQLKKIHLSTFIWSTDYQIRPEMGQIQKHETKIQILCIEVEASADGPSDGA